MLFLLKNYNLEIYIFQIIFERIAQDKSRIEFSFPHTPAENKFFLPLVFTNMLLSAKGMRKSSILTSGGNKECLKSQA